MHVRIFFTFILNLFLELNPAIRSIFLFLKKNKKDATSIRARDSRISNESCFQKYNVSWKVQLLEGK
jgi:hypothetical protein